MERLRIDLRNIDATIRIFDPLFLPGDIKPTIPKAPMLAHFHRGEYAQRMRELLRDAGGKPLTASEMADLVIAEKGLDITDRRSRWELVGRFIQSLHGMQRRGHVKKIGYGKDVRWTVPNVGE